MNYSFVAFAGTLFTLALSAATPSNARSTSSNIGTPNSKDTGATANYTNEPGGKFTVNWWKNGTFVGGKGWSPGSSDRVFNYIGIFEPSGYSLVTFYGWTRDPRVEYYIVESFGDYTPATDTVRKGEATCNGATYEIGNTWRPDPDSPNFPIGSFQQIWAVRVPKKGVGKINGTIDFGCHVRAWRALGMELGAHDWQIMAIDGYFSSGHATIEII
ncbi:xylanase 5 protein [Coprinopsis cinerea okayama7|uniref:Endo-1,4-beta-xylanase n=1 Tax=Coprinopsis cinerea (strain Okayama-7 / 130 / ATCC MYA-4618 / FGSC 9003) TaxID=240176 RepID=A8PG06_COPC7|nr:xylanase 5 protein [Coprinopsis cinerea okayama7\|eukprot:XP_001841114.2 xylanase 5 protein [Coprinopsis cinerea okayama7\